MTYIDGFVTPAFAGTTREAYTDFAAKAAIILKEHGALRVVEGWGDDVFAGKVTDFARAVRAGEGETIVFSWIEWPDKAARNAGMKALMADPRMQPGDDPIPFDMKRMIFGGFAVVVDT